MLPPGRHRFNIVSEKVAVVNMKSVCLDIPPQRMMSKDNMEMKPDAVCFYNVFDPQKAIFAVQDYADALNHLATVTMRTVASETSLAEMFSERPRINRRIAQLIGDASERWGIRVHSFHLRGIEVSERMQRALAARAEAGLEAQAVFVAACARGSAASILSEAAERMAGQPGALRLQCFDEALRAVAAQAGGPPSGALAQRPQRGGGRQSDEDLLSAQSDDELGYHSCSEDGASTAGSPSPAHRRFTEPAPALGPPLGVGAGIPGVRVGDFHARQAALPRGGHPHSWGALEASKFDVRSSTYLGDRKKCPSAPALMDLINVDFTLVGEDGPVWRVCDHPDMFPAHHVASGDGRFLLVLNWVFPPYQAVLAAAVDPAAPWLLGDDSPEGRCWKRFVEADETGRRDLFKMIGSIEQGPWLVKRALPKKPVLIGKRVRMDTRYEPGRHMEIVFDVSGGRAEQYACNVVCGSLKRIEMAFTVLIEAREEQQLPERMLMSGALRNCDPSLLLSPPPVGGAAPRDGSRTPVGVMVPQPPRPGVLRGPRRPTVGLRAVRSECKLGKHAIVATSNRLAIDLRDRFEPSCSVVKVIASTLASTKLQEL
ncbi:unnamed protein product [Prorocentrum cordatum]|uniref:Band 7 domain-containing protein n=1 Tax=Prorocentrum cordatum TaxID=2364126 RepID=A0ABN9Y204_9DINO|nr:unnamed protein product [Polarella glacialis]